MQNNAYWKTGGTVCKITSGTEEYMYMLQEINEENISNDLKPSKQYKSLPQ